MAKKKIKSLKYFRDLGGVQTPDGLKVKSGLLFRSCELSKLKEEDYLLLKHKYNVGIDIDLRAPEESKRKPDAIKSEMKYFSIPLANDNENPAVTRENRIEILKIRMKDEGGMNGHMMKLYRMMVTSDRGITGFRKVFEILLENKNEKSVIFHCTQGKDRTGLTGALILCALGVDKEAIIDDYLKFNQGAKIVNFFINIGVSVALLSVKKAHALNIALSARRNFIEAAFDEIDKQYGDINNYLTKAIGLTKKDIALLRKLYLEK